MSYLVEAVRSLVIEGWNWEALALGYIIVGHARHHLGILRERYCIAIVTHNMQQAARVSDKTAFMYLGELIEFDETNKIFTSPSDRRTQDYITGRFG